MTIVCGVDFSEASTSAVRTAAALAKLSNERLLLVHAAETGHEEDAVAAELLELLRARLARRARALRDQRLAVESLVAVGVPDEVLLEAARQHSARWIVVGAYGHRKRSVPKLGGHAERLAQQGRVPVLVARRAEAFEAWARGERPLKILLGLDLSAGTFSAASWVAELTRLGPCEVTAVHVYWPPTEWRRFGLSGIRPIVEPTPEVTRALEHDFEFCRQTLAGAARLELCVEPNLGSVGSRLAELAQDRGLDLVAVGSHARGTLRRVWEGSVSHAVLEFATTSVACVPSTSGASAVTRGSASSVVVATDFSSIGNAAIHLAYQNVQDGGTVHIVHVTRRASTDPLAPHDIFDDGPETEAVCKRIAALVPEHYATRVKTEVHALNASNCVEAICQAAERLGAGTICLGTHGRTGVAQAVLGSVAAGVLRESTRRVVLVRPAVS